MSEQAASQGGASRQPRLAPVRITVDCEPFQARPDSALTHLFATLHLDVQVPEPTSKCFGEWSFIFNEEDSKTLRALKDQIATEFVRVYESGAIRYAEWNM